MTTEKKVFESISIYGEPLAKTIVKVKVPKNPNSVTEDVIGLSWIEPHTFADRQGNLIEVKKHLRHGYLAQPEYDGSMGGLRTERVIISRNFYVTPEMCGKMIVALAVVTPKHSKGKVQEITFGDQVSEKDIDADKVIIDYYPVKESSAVELKFPEERKSDKDIPVPGTKKFIHFKDTGYTWHMTIDC